MALIPSPNNTQIAGSDFKDPVFVSAIVVNGICAFSFTFLALAAFRIYGRKERGRWAFSVLAGLLGNLFLLVSSSDLAFCGTNIKTITYTRKAHLLTRPAFGVTDK